MNLTLRLPPTQRDFQIYQRLTLEGVTTRQAAADFALSQTRIRQIAQKVNHWLADSLPATSEEQDAAHLRLAQNLAADRLQFLYGQAMQGWRLTSQPKYATVILRVINANARLAVIPGTIEALAADALEGPLPDVREGEAHGEPQVSSVSHPSFIPQPSSFSSPPPPRDCSTAARNSPATPQPVAPQRAATPDLPTNSVAPAIGAAAARRAFLAPAQTPLTNDHSSVVQLKITPQALGLSTEQKLSRRDRRKLRQKLHAGS